MEPIIKHFFRIAFLGLILAGLADGGAAWLRYQPARLHPDLENAARILYLQGFLLPALAGFCYHMLPKLMGSFLRHPSLVGWHLLSVLAGCGGLALLLTLRAFDLAPVGELPLLIAQVLLVLGQWLFAFNLLRSFNFRGK